MKKERSKTVKVKKKKRTMVVELSPVPPWL
jgi:hypothetical protein